MPCLIHQFRAPLTTGEEERYVARIYGDQVQGLWEGWLVFVPVDGGPTLRTPVETEQATRQDLGYWAVGLGTAYLESALDRARDQLRSRPAWLSDPAHPAA